MPVRDLFHAPWNDQDLWEGFHSAWANTLVRHLNGVLLPPQYRAVPHIHLGTFVETDVGTFERNGRGRAPATEKGEASVATLPWAPPAPAQTLLVDFLDQASFQVKVFDEDSGRRLVGVIELVSPGNKDRPETRKVFAGKCLAYLQQEIGLIIADVVTNRRANLHRELLDMLSQDSAAAGTADLYAVAYQAGKHQEHWRLQIWPFVLAVGADLPTLPLWLAPDFTVPIDLEKSYEETCQVLRID
jgi:hypothetical protein